MIKYIIFTLFVHNVASADPAFGVKLFDKTESLLIHDFSVFSLQTPDTFGLRRYGVGRGQLELKDTVALKASTHSGVFLGPETNIGTGIELASGSIGYNKSAYFNYKPAVSIGFKTQQLYIGPRVGTIYNNADSPKNFIGSVSIFQTEFVSFSHFNTLDENVYDISTMNFNIQKLVNDKETVYYIGIKDLF